MPNFRGGRRVSADFFTGAPCRSSHVALTFSTILGQAKMVTTRRKNAQIFIPLSYENEELLKPTIKPRSAVMRYVSILDELPLAPKRLGIRGRMSLRLIERPDATTNAASGRFSAPSSAFRRPNLSTQLIR